MTKKWVLLQMKLVQLREGSSSGVISLDDTNFPHYAASPDRTYSLVIFFNAKMKETPSLNMGQMFDSFKLTAQHVKKVAKEQEHASAANRVFFVALEFAQSQQSFARLSVQSIPWIVHLGPKAKVSCVPGPPASYLFVLGEPRIGEAIPVSCRYCIQTLKTTNRECFFMIVSLLLKMADALGVTPRGCQGAVTAGWL
jgi:hypothetical protein